MDIAITIRVEFNNWNLNSFNCSVARAEPIDLWPFHSWQAAPGVNQLTWLKNWAWPLPLLPCPLFRVQSAILIDIWHLCATFVITTYSFAFCLYSLLLLLLPLLLFICAHFQRLTTDMDTHTHTEKFYELALSRRQQTIFDISTFINQNGNYGETYTHTRTQGKQFTHVCGKECVCVCVLSKESASSGQFNWPKICSILLSAGRPIQLNENCSILLSAGIKFAREQSCRCGKWQQINNNKQK